MGKKVLVIEMDCGCRAIAETKFPESLKQFTQGVGGIASAGMFKPKCFLDGTKVVVELSMPSQQGALLLLPAFQKQMKEQVEKEKREKGSCIPCKVFLRDG